MSTINVLTELTTLEHISLHDALQRHEMHALTYDLKDNLHALALVCFLYDTGCRPSEAKNLLMSHVDTYGQSAIVQYRNKSRLVHFHTYTREVLEQWIKARPDLPHGKVFYNPMTLIPFSRPEIIKYVGILLNNAGINQPGMSIYSFRASFALRAMSGMHPRCTRVLLGLPTGHKDAVIFSEDIAAAACLMGYHPPKRAVDFWE